MLDHISLCTVSVPEVKSTRTDKKVDVIFIIWIQSLKSYLKYGKTYENYIIQRVFNGQFSWCLCWNGRNLLTLNIQSGEHCWKTLRQSITFRSSKYSITAEIIIAKIKLNLVAKFNHNSPERNPLNRKWQKRQKKISINCLHDFDSVREKWPKMKVFTKLSKKLCVVVSIATVIVYVKRTKVFNFFSLL